jgi:hypothetical protein
VKTLRLELHTLIAGAFWKKMSIEKNVNFLNARSSSAELLLRTVNNGHKAARDSLHSAGHFREYRSAKHFDLSSDECSDEG